MPSMSSRMFCRDEIVLHRAICVLLSVIVPSTSELLILSNPLVFLAHNDRRAHRALLAAHQVEGGITTR